MHSKSFFKNKKQKKKNTDVGFVIGWAHQTNISFHKRLFIAFASLTLFSRH